MTDNSVTGSVEEMSNITDENFFVDKDEEENDSLDDGNEEGASTDLDDMTELNSTIKDTHIKQKGNLFWKGASHYVNPEFNPGVMHQSIPSTNIPPGDPWGFALCRCPGARIYT